MPRPIDRARWLRLAPFFATLCLVGTTFGQEADPAPAPPIVMPNPVPLDAPVVIVLRPAALLKLPGMKEAYTEFFAQAASKEFINVLKADSVEEVTLTLLRREFKPGDVELAIAKAGAIVVKTADPRDWTKLAAAAQLPTVKATHAGSDYSRFVSDPEVKFGFYQPDARTVIYEDEANLLKAIDSIKAGGEAKAPKIAGCSAKTVAVGAVDFVWLRELLAPQIRGHTATSVGVAFVGPLWEKTTYATVRLDVDDDRAVTLVADNSCTDEDGAKAVEKTVESILILTRNVAPEYVKMLLVEAENRPQTKELAALFEQVLKSASVTREGAKVRFQVSLKADLEKLMKLLR